MSTQPSPTDLLPDLAQIGVSSEPSLDGHLLRIIAGGPQDRSKNVAPLSGVSRTRERRYRRFLDALGVALYTTDASGRITFYNAAAASFWGRRPRLGEQWCGSLELFWPDGRPMAHDECPMAVALKRGIPVHGHEALAGRPDGSQAAFLAYPTPLRDERDVIVGAVNVLVDVTERRRAEAALRATATELEASNLVKDEFLGLVSHELRTPVTTILGNARLLQDRADGLGEDKRRSMLADIAADAERLHEIIENLLYMTRLGAGARADLEPIVIDRVVLRSVELLRRRYPANPILVSSAPCLIVDAERTYLELLVENLVGNAVKYSGPERPVEIIVDEVDGQARVRVLDRGIGLEDGELETLFEPFYRGARARSTANGIGIGLAVCQRIAGVLGGRLWARPRADGGAEFGFELPLIDETEDALAILTH